MAGLRLACPVSRSLTTPLGRTLYTSARPSSPSPSSSSSPRPLPSYTLFNYTLAFTLPFSFWGLFGGGGANSAGKSSASSGVDVTSKSSTVFREQNAFVGRQQASTLMFASVRGEGRKDWQSWIGYFRDQGFDCIDANLDFEPKSGSGSAAPSSSGDDAGKQAAPGKGKGEEHKILADELTSQIRLSSLQRSPLLFIHASPSSSLLGLGSSSSPSPISILHAHLTTRPFIAGLIIVEKTAGEARAQAQRIAGAGAGAPGGGESGEKVLEEMSSKLGGRLLVVRDSEEGIKEGERWMVEKGF